MKKLKIPFFHIMNIPSDDLDMDDIQVMWEALMLKNSIPIPENWGDFINEINCILSENQVWFNKKFDQYF
jgi:hypothetical protein